MKITCSSSVLVYQQQDGVAETDVRVWGDVFLEMTMLVLVQPESECSSMRIFVQTPQGSKAQGAELRELR